jgi:YjbE family integral membrane protein
MIWPDLSFNVWTQGATLLQIIGINLLLSGDNALVIALVMRGLRPADRRRGIVIGTLGAVVMRVLLTLGAWRLLTVPGLRLVGGLTLLWMGWRLALDQQDTADPEHAPASLKAAIRQVIWADLVMSADNVLAVAGAAHGHLELLLLGLATSIPLVALGSGVLGRILDRFPAAVIAGGALLGWVGGELIEGDPLVAAYAAPLQGLLPAATTLLVLLLVWWGRRDRPTREARHAAAKHRL